MKFVKSISLFFVYPVAMFGIGFWLGVETSHFFYPGEKQEYQIQVSREESTVQEFSVQEPTVQELSVQEPEHVTQAASLSETLCVDTEYIIAETDVDNGTVVETTGRLPDKYIGLDREQFLAAMANYEMFPPLSELERGFVNLEVLSFSRDKVVVQMNYRYIQPGKCFYLAVRDNEVVVYLEDMETVYINTGIELSSLPEETQQEIIQMIWMEDEESLYHFLENYSS